jgi:hypothetical protein
MNIMNMPGFTAEASLYKTINHYHMIEAIHQADGTVHAAQLDLDCYSQCISECIQSDGAGAQCGPACIDECSNTAVTCGRCVGFRQCSDGSQRPCSTL